MWEGKKEGTKENGVCYTFFSWGFAKLKRTYLGQCFELRVKFFILVQCSRADVMIIVSLYVFWNGSILS